MDRFWIFLEALARILEDGQAVESLKKHFSELPQGERHRLSRYLRIVGDSVPRISTDVELS